MVKNNKAREEKAERRNKIILGVFITVIMVGSTLGFFVGSTDNSNDGIEYNAKNGEKYNFMLSQGLYYTKINNKQLEFYNLPFTIEKLNISDEIFNSINNAGAIYITFNPDSENIQYIEQTRFDLANELEDFNKYVISGIINESKIYNAYPIITCENSTMYFPVINFIDSNKTSDAYKSDSCIIVEGDTLDFLRFRDYIIYKFYNVI